MKKSFRCKVRGMEKIGFQGWPPDPPRPRPPSAQSPLGSGGGRMVWTPLPQFFGGEQLWGWGSSKMPPHIRTSVTPKTFSFRSRPLKGQSWGAINEEGRSSSPCLRCCADAAVLYVTNVDALNTNETPIAHFPSSSVAIYFPFLHNNFHFLNKHSCG